jgi:carbamate kinase
VISTGVPRVALDFGKPTQRNLDRLTRDEAAQHLAEGQFGKGSMGPKVEAAIRYLDGGGRRVVITSPDQIEDAVEGAAGPVIER